MSVSRSAGAHGRAVQKVLHVGPDMSAQGGIASVIGGYAQRSELFESQGYTLSFAATCGARGGLRRIRQFARAWWKVVSGAVSRNIDIVHIHTSVRGSLLRKWLLAMTCIGLRQKYILHLHNGAMAQYIETLPALCRKAVRLMWKRAAQVICLSRDMEAWLDRDRLCHPEKRQLIYNGISDPASDVAFGRSGSQPPTILFLGRLVEAKGIKVLLEAAERLKRLGHPYRLLVAGSGDLQAFLTDVEHRNLSMEVEHLGWATGEQKAQLLANADIFVLPSRSEGFPVAIVEAMAYGATIVSTNIPGVTDAIVHGRDGLLVSPDAADQLCDALAKLITSPALRTQLAAAARQRFLDRFTIERTVECLVSAYDKALH